MPKTLKQSDIQKVVDKIKKYIGAQDTVSISMSVRSYAPTTWTVVIVGLDEPVFQASTWDEVIAYAMKVINKRRTNHES